MNPETLFPPATGEVLCEGKLQGKYRRTYTDYCALERALLADNIGAALDAFVRLLEDAPSLAEALSRVPFPTDSSRLLAFQELGHCLVTDDLKGAKRALMRFQ